MLEGCCSRCWLDKYFLLPYTLIMFSVFVVCGSFFFQYTNSVFNHCYNIEVNIFFYSYHFLIYSLLFSWSLLLIIAAGDYIETTNEDDQEMHNFPSDEHPDHPFLNNGAEIEQTDTTQVYIDFLSLKSLIAIKTNGKILYSESSILLIDSLQNRILTGVFTWQFYWFCI